MLDISRYLGLPPPASAHAHQIDFVIGLVHWLMLALFVGWSIYFIYVLYRFRASKNPIPNYRGTKGTLSKYQEIGVVLAEAILLAGFSIPLWGQLRHEIPTDANRIELRVVAEQFAWNVHYPGPDGVFGRTDINLVDLQTNPLGLDRNDPAARDDIVTVNEIHVPVNKLVLIHLSSRDVIHSFNLPNMRVKQDAIPGLSIPVWFRPIRTGDYDIACAQLCGLGHYRMRGHLIVESEEEFQAWLKEQAEMMQEYGF
ncbi:MAG: cytochrome c oxidase subunit II [Calditrichaeota bacterium]|nr:MAG: cytochrome c oxidase subunit II [Calditrichota bacterium]